MQTAQLCFRSEGDSQMGSSTIAEQIFFFFVNPDFLKK